MNLNPYIVLGSAVVGLLVGLTGAGGGALITPLLPGAAAMVFRYILDRRSGTQRTGTVGQVAIRPLATVLIGMAGGLIVGMTSVGSGSLMIVLLLFLYPLLSAG